MKKEVYEKIAACLNVSYPIPDEKKILETVAIIEQKLSIKAINKSLNAPVKEGYTKALAILRSNQKDYSGVEFLKTKQGKAISMLAVDYLNGQCSQEILCRVPLK